MSYRYQRPRQRPRQGPGCLGMVAWFGVILLVLVALYGLLARPQLSAFVGGLAADQIAPAPAAPAELSATAEGAIPGAVAALPPGELVITEGEANGYIAANPAALGPIDQLRLRFTAGRAEADLSAYGLSGQASAGLAAQAGQIVVLDPRIDGALGLVLSGPELTGVIAERLNAEMARQGRAVEDVRVEEGRIVLVTR